MVHLAEALEELIEKTGQKSVKFDYGEGIPINLNLFAKQYNDLQTKAYCESMGQKANSIEAYMIAPPITDNLVKNMLIGAPIQTDAYDKDSYVNTNEQRLEALAKAIGAEKAETCHFDGAGKRVDDPKEVADRMNNLSIGAKALTATSNWIHVIADDKISVLFLRPEPFQSVITTEAIKGKTARWDVAPPYGLMGTYAGTEDPIMTESDFPTYTRDMDIKYNYTVGRITDAAIRAGASAVPSRDMWAIATENALASHRAYRERSSLGITRNVKSINNSYEPATALEYDGIHALTTNSSGTYQTWINNTGHTNAIASTDTREQQIAKLESMLVESAQKMLVMGITPDFMMCDLDTFGLFRERLMKTQYGVPPTPEYSFGISFIQYALPGMPTLNLVQHPYLPRTTGNRAVYLLDTKLLAYRVGWRDERQPLARNNPSEKFYISSAEVLIDKSDIDGSSSLMGGVFNY